MEKEMNVLSLFDGISCGRVALERADIKVDNYFSSEIDEKALKIADKNYPQDKKNRLGDVKNININELPKIDLLIGGSPCQSFSFIGKMNGMTTKENMKITSLDQYLELKNKNITFEGQSYLFWEYMRILKEVKPKFFLLENVRMKQEWKDILTNAIECEPIEINSSLVSAQNRLRLYWTNIPNVNKPKDKGILFKDIQENLPFRELKPFMFNNYGDKSRLSKTKCLNSNKANCCTTKKTHTSQYYLNNERNKMRNLSINEYERLQTLPDNYTEGICDTERYKCVGNGWTVDVIAHIFKNMNK